MVKDNDNFGLTSIRNRILLFAFLITLVPSLCVGWLISNMMHTTLEEKIEQKLLNLSDSIERELALWFKERSYDLHVFSNSFVIHENYSLYLEAKAKNVDDNSGAPSHIHAIVTYLTSLKKQFNEYNSLFLLDNEGVIVASSQNSEEDIGLMLPKDMTDQLENSQFFRGPIHFETDSDLPFMLMGTPLFAKHSEKYIGILAIKVSLATIQDLINSAAWNTNNPSQVEIEFIHLPSGRYFLSTNKAGKQEEPIFASDETLQSFNGSSALRYFTNHRENKVIGVLTQIDDVDWGLVLSEDYDTVFSRVSETRFRNFLIICFLSLIIGVAAYFLTRQIIRPLTTLTQGAQKVANGNLSIRLPVEKNDELGFATRVFNEMVAELNQSQTKLEKLATQDVLTQLANRKQILRILHNRFEYYQRYKNVFSILMIDVDHFKKVNDTYGHMAGDKVLRDIGQIFIDTLRSFDSAGRYGGEEFLVILADSDEEDAKNAAERIRLAVANHIFLWEKSRIQVTVSIGIAKISAEDREENTLINRADKALYAAKENGRNCLSYLAPTG